MIESEINIGDRNLTDLSDKQLKEVNSEHIRRILNNLENMLYITYRNLNYDDGLTINNLWSVDSSNVEKHNMTSCMLSILDSLKLYDTNSLLLENETLSEVMFRKMKAYNVDLNKELDFTHLEPVKYDENK